MIEHGALICEGDDDEIIGGHPRSAWKQALLMANQHIHLYKMLAEHASIPAPLAAWSSIIFCVGLHHQISNRLGHASDTMIVHDLLKEVSAQANSIFELTTGQPESDQLQ